VCLARHIPLPEIRPPRSGPAPAITVVPHARELVNTRIFVSLAIRVDNSVLSHEQERAYKCYYLPETYEGDLEPLEEPLWVLLHNRPLNDLKPRFARITHPDHSDQIVFTEGIIPGLKRGFRIEPQQYPKLFKYWHSLVKAHIKFRLENTEQGMNLRVTIGVQNKTIVVTFYPFNYLGPSII